MCADVICQKLSIAKMTSDRPKSVSIKKLVNREHKKQTNNNIGVELYLKVNLTHC